MSCDEKLHEALHAATSEYDGKQEGIVEWDVRLLERTVFQEKLKTRPWILHTEIEPKIKMHMFDPLTLPKSEEDGVYLCTCHKVIPVNVMQRYFFLKSTC